MRFLTTRFHGFLDYLMGIFLIAAPWLLGFAEDGPSTWVPVFFGSGMILYSLVTDYELGVARAISMKTHLLFDFLGGAFLAASPWIFGFADYIYLPHLILGIAEMGASLTTKTVPSQDRPHTIGHSGNVAHH